MKPIELADLKTKNAPKAWRSLTLNNPGSHLHPNCETNFQQLPELNFDLQTSQNKGIPDSWENVESFTNYLAWTLGFKVPSLTQNFELIKIFPLLTFSELDRLLERFEVGATSRKNSNKEISNFEKNGTSFTEFNSCRIRVFRTHSQHILEWKEIFHFLLSLRWGSCFGYSKAIDWRSIWFSASPQNSKLFFEICSKSTRQNNFCVFHKNLPT